MHILLYGPVFIAFGVFVEADFIAGVDNLLSAGHLRPTRNFL